MQHLDEGTIHAWLDGELSADEAEKSAAHASECPECGALVAEARGLIAASTRILTALDNVPAGVAPGGSVLSEKPGAVGAASFRRHWYDRGDFRAAAALLFVVGASLVAVKLGRNPDASFKAVMSAARSPSTAAPLLQDTGAPAAAEIAQRDKPSEMNAMVGGTAGADQRRRNENAAVISPPTVSSKVAAKSSSGNFGMVRAMDDVSSSNARTAAVPSGPINAPAIPTPSLNKSAEPLMRLRESAVGGVARSDAPIPGRVQGVVMDKVRGKGIGAANVRVEGTTLSAITDQEGRFRIDSVPAGERQLNVRRIGYTAQIVPLAVNERSGATATVALTPSTTALDELVVSGVATAGTMGATDTSLHVLKVDSIGSVRRFVYQVSPGVEVTLVESPIDVVAQRDLIANRSAGEEKAKDSGVAAKLLGATAQTAAKADRRAAQAPAPMAAAAATRPTINTISWMDLSRRYTLSGPLKPSELEAIKARLMKMRR